MTCRDCEPTWRLVRTIGHSTCLAVAVGALLGLLVGCLTYREPASNSPA